MAHLADTNRYLEAKARLSRVAAKRDQIKMKFGGNSMEAQNAQEAVTLANRALIKVLKDERKGV